MRTEPRAHFTPLALVGLTGFAVSLWVHVLTYLGIALQEHTSAVWLLHVGLFPPSFVMVIRLQRWSTGSWWFRTGFRWRELAAYLPAWAIFSVVGLFGYAFVNFLLATSHLPAGVGATATVESGAATGSHLQAVYTARAFSGHWLIFYGLPALFFLYVPANARPDPDQERQAGAAA
jgi:hypothetical protein